MIKRIMALLLCVCFCAVPLASCSHIHRYDKCNTGKQYLKMRGMKCTDESEYYYSCACGKKDPDGKTFKQSGEHDFSKERVLNKYLCTEATVEKRATYYISCVNCGEKGSETFMYGDKLPLFNHKNIIIFGDSYSTCSGSIPNGYATWYPNLDVEGANETWWSLFAEKTASKIVQNNSWSGSTIGYTGYDGKDCSADSSFIYRYRELKNNGFFAENKVDTVLVFGGTNDSWSNAPLGEMMYEGWTEDDLYNVLPAICHFASTLKTDLPDATVVLIINDGIKAEIQDAMENAAKYYGIEYVRLEGIGKESGHPNAKGMKQICDQLLDVLNK